MKEFHIITVGTSIITNAQKKKVAGLTGNERVSDEEFWEKKMENENFINALTKFLKSSPMENSAEMNTFLRVVKDKKPEDISVYLISTKTKIGEICKIVLQNFLKENNYNLFTGIEISGYFWESSYFKEEFAQNEFKRDISEMLDRLIYIALRKKKEGFKVFFNPTGGLKAHVISCAIAGFLTNSEVYYMNEEFKDVVFLPFLLYLPKGKEIEVLNKLSDKRPKSGKEYEEMESEYPEEIERLETYGLVEREENEAGKFYRIKITNKGIFWLNQLEKKK